MEAHAEMGLLQVCKNLGIDVRYYPSDGMDQIGIPTTGGGEAIFIDGKFYILCNRNRTQEELRYIIAHELGHILLGHLTFRTENGEFPATMELEANIFAAVMLAFDLTSRELAAAQQEP